MDYGKLAYSKANELDSKLNGFFSSDTFNSATDEKFPNANFIGARVTDVNPRRMILTTPKERPPYDENTTILNGGMTVMQYTDHDVLDKKVLAIGLGFEYGMQYFNASFFGKYYPDYNGLVYVFDETSDKLGLGITLQQGWYAINSTTFATTPIDINECPILILKNAIDADEDKKPEAHEYFVPQEKIEYVAEKQNVATYDGYTFVSPYAVSDWCTRFTEEDACNLLERASAHTAMYVSVVADDNGYFDDPAVLIEGQHIKVTWPAQLDPKFLPDGVGGVYDIDLTPFGYDASNFDVQELALSAEKANEIYDAIKNGTVRWTTLDESFGMWIAYTAFTQATVGDTEAIAGFMNFYGDTKYSLVVTMLSVSTEAHTATVTPQLFPLT